MIPDSETRDIIKRLFLRKVFFLGINDCGGIPGEDLSSSAEVLFDAIHRLYIGATARNFILVDVPPTDRSPAGERSCICTQDVSAGSYTVY